MPNRLSIKDAPQVDFTEAGSAYYLPLIKETLAGEITPHKTNLTELSSALPSIAPAFQRTAHYMTVIEASNAQVSNFGLLEHNTALAYSTLTFQQAMGDLAIGDVLHSSITNGIVTLVEAGVWRISLQLELDLQAFRIEGAIRIQPEIELTIGTSIRSFRSGYIRVSDRPIAIHVFSSRYQVLKRTEANEVIGIRWSFRNIGTARGGNSTDIRLQPRAINGNKGTVLLLERIEA